MSEAFDPDHDHPSDLIDRVIVARPRDLGGFSVRRALPSVRQRLVGPFVFFDQMGPATLPPNQGMDVRPHPHIALATVTYLFEGAIFHRDSLGSAIEIRPGDVNWMIAGRGIVHSERTPPAARAAGHRSHGIQAWVALRKDEEERAPEFIHHPVTSLPFIERDGVAIRLISGDAYGQHAPTPTSTPTIYVDVKIASGAKVEVPGGYEERAVYVVSGSVRVGPPGSAATDVAAESAADASDDAFGEGTMVVLRQGAEVELTAVTPAQVMILGGAPIDGERFVWWNFVSSSKERIERAKADWKEGRFPKVPGDDVELIPLPES